MLIKHEAKPSALLASRPSAEYFIFHIARARRCFKWFMELSSHGTAIYEVTLVTNMLTWPERTQTSLTKQLTCGSPGFSMVDVYLAFWQVLVITHNRLYCVAHGEAFPWYLQDLSVYSKNVVETLTFSYPQSKRVGTCIKAIQWCFLCWLGCWLGWLVTQRGSGY